LGGISGEFWPRGSCVAARGARAAGGYAGDRVSANAESPPSRIVSNAALCGHVQEHQGDAFICDTSPLAPPLAERLVDGATDLAPEFAADLLVLPK